MTKPPKDLYRDRRQRLCEAHEHGLLLLLRGDAPFYEDLFYLTGLTTYHSAFLLDLRTGEEEAWVWGVDYDQARADTDVHLLHPSASVLNDVIAEIQRRSPRRLYIGVKDEGFASIVCELSAKPSVCQVAAAAPLIAPLRRIKDDWELGCLRRAQVNAETVMRAVLQGLRPGITEREVAADVLSGLVRLGATRPSFPIVAFGEHTAEPHHVATSRPLSPGDLVLIDIFGEAVGHYCAELTETVLFQGNDRILQARIDAIAGALRVLESRIQPGMRFGDLEALAREQVDGDSLQAEFLGVFPHHVGLNEHDPTDGTEPLATGQVIALEPCLYSERLGVRKERVVYV